MHTPFFFFAMFVTASSEEEEFWDCDDLDLENFEGDPWEVIKSPLFSRCSLEVLHVSYLARDSHALQVKEMWNQPTIDWLSLLYLFVLGPHESVVSQRIVCSFEETREDQVCADH